MKRIISFCTLALGLSLVSQASWGAVHFVKPTYNGYGLDWCTTFGQGCGKQAADLYCQKKNYAHALNFQIQPSVGFQTMTIGQNSVCNPAVTHCDCFAYIDCQEISKCYVSPKYNNFRLDWCRTFGAECGQPAAQAFCQSKGFAFVQSFQFQGLLSVETMTIGSNAVCDPQYHRCDSFSYIQCRN